MRSLGITGNNNVKVRTLLGSVTVKAKKSPDRLRSGIAFIPYGPWANMVIDSTTNSTGMPLLKGFNATIESTNERVFDAIELLK